jgi:membrane fusion protein, multidrug efflux system
VDLIRTHAISQEDADIRESTVRQAEASVEEAQAAVDAAKLDVEFTQVTAPVSGRIGRKLVTAGNLITGGVGTQGTLLTTVVSLDPIYVYFDADEGSYLKYARLARTGQRPSSRDHRNRAPAAVWTMIEQWVPVWVGLGDEEGFPREGEMDFVDNQFDRGTGTIVGRAVLPNPELTLAPGLFARLRLPGSDAYRALLIPDEAVGSDQSQKFVFVVNGENKIEYRTVQTGPLSDGLRIVRAGLTPDDWVIVGGTQRARNGLTVDPQRQAIAQSTPSPSPVAATRTPDTAATPVGAR